MCPNNEFSVHFVDCWPPLKTTFKRNPPPCNVWASVQASVPSVWPSVAISATSCHLWRQPQGTVFIPSVRQCQKLNGIIITHRWHLWLQNGLRWSPLVAVCNANFAPNGIVPTEAPISGFDVLYSSIWSDLANRRCYFPQISLICSDLPSRLGIGLDPEDDEGVGSWNNSRKPLRSLHAIVQENVFNAASVWQP